MLDGDMAEVQAQFSLTDPIPDALPAAHGLVEVNRSFLAIAAGQPKEAEQHYRAARSMIVGIDLRGWTARISTLGALVAWSNGDLATAETVRRAAIADEPDEETPHAYLVLRGCSRREATRQVRTPSAPSPPAIVVSRPTSRLCRSRCSASIRCMAGCSDGVDGKVGSVTLDFLT